MRITDLKIGTRLGLGFGVMCLALVFAVGLGVANLAKVNEGTSNIAVKRLPRLDLTTRVLSEVNDIAIALRNMILTDDAADRIKQREEIASSGKDIEAIFANLDKMLQSQRGRELLQQQQELNVKY